MSGTSGLRFLCPYLLKDISVSRRSIYVRFFNTTRCLSNATSFQNPGPGRLRKRVVGAVGINEDRGPIEERIRELEEGRALGYPRIQRLPHSLSLLEYQRRYASLKANEKRPDEIVAVYGRLKSMRIQSKKLAFFDIEQEGHALQVLCYANGTQAFAGVTDSERRRFHRIVRRGDIISVQGTPCVTHSGELTINTAELPIILSPSLRQVPQKMEDPSTRIRNRHIDMIVNKQVGQRIRLRSYIIQYIREFLLKDNFLEVQTPIISDSAGGAIARPFTTVATEFSDKQLALRVAPEIWLKRLVIGGMDRIFEIGPAFRNEGLDATHNPEFTICEFYKSFADLEDLMAMTENLLLGLAKRVADLCKYPLDNLPELDAKQFVTPFKRIHFIPAIEESLGEKLPNLSADDAQDQLLELFTLHNIAPPSSPTLPRLLDKLSSIYLEPGCTAPTFIMHHPACLAPLSKSFFDTKIKQHVSARVELFIQNREIANMYEEENSPFEQRRKFVEQAKWKDDENKALIDESYLEALEWAMPPTGGWGCGIDRLCMLFSGASRIGDVLPFGSLKNVVNLGSRGGVDKGEEDAKDQETT